MSEQGNHQNQMSDADALMGRRILLSVALIGAVLLVALAWPQIRGLF